jgi:2-keto-4-pentenoate hydratase/2-oxohepta-3-ene-1,7-dioic acid hydratase in catechol pathway
MKLMIAVTSILLLALVLGTYLLAKPAFQEQLGPGSFAGITVAPRDQALTLARTVEGKSLLVMSADEQGVTAIDIGVASGSPFEDGLEAYSELGPGGLQALFAANPITVAWDRLGLPLQATYPHIAAGTNFHAHAEEVGLDAEPFLFPKLSHASAWNAPVAAGKRLDHEVELCAVPLTEHLPASPARLGYLLCGDFTDRWTLIRKMQFDSKMGRTGFPAGKGGSTRLPVGPFLVIPLAEDFYERVELRLYVNGALRQRASAGQMIWAPQDILSRALEDCRSPYTLGSETLSISACDRIPAGTLILTGTPEGVMFHLLTLWSPWAYLQPGDRVTGYGTYLGLTQNTIVGPAGPEGSSNE